MDTRAARDTFSDVKDVVVLVHGTYAASSSDTGSGWWQSGSRVWNRLREKLPTGVQLADAGVVFHWSGENSERARSKAGSQLLARLRTYEETGQAYHLIGHSHGGSVIWHALRQATLQRRPLSLLRSWSTVGTPFLKHRTRGVWHLANIVNLLLAIALLRPAFYTMRKVIQLFGCALLGLDHGIVITRERAPALTEAARGPILRLLQWLGVSVQDTAQGIRLGSFDPAAGKSFFEYLFLSPEGWLILGIVMVCLYVYLNLAVFFLSPLVESLRIRQETRLEQRVLRQYRGKWLGLWSGDDEAINGLRTTLALSMSFVQRMAIRETVFFSDRLMWVSRPYHWVLIPVYNAVLRPMLDGLIRSHVVKTALGNNRPAAEVIAVATAPGPVDRTCELPTLPDWLNLKITAEADRHACDVAPQLRCLLAEPSFASGLETFSGAISGHELVHTSYFDHAEVLELLAAHIAWARGECPRISERSSPAPSLAVWFQDFKHRLGQRVVLETQTAPLLKPRRAA